VYRNNHEIHVSDEVFWKKDGTAIPVEYWSKPLPADNVMQGAIATFIDITERKLAEAHIHNLAFYDSLLSSQKYRRQMDGRKMSERGQDSWPRPEADC